MNEPLTEASTQLATTADFPTPSNRFCSLQTCVNGHEWVPKLIAVKCPGCEAPMLALMMVNCPICNEPTNNTFLRMDHLAQGGGIQPLCKGGATLAETIGLQIPHNHAAQEQTNYKEREVITKA